MSVNKPYGGHIMDIVICPESIKITLKLWNAINLESKNLILYNCMFLYLEVSDERFCSNKQLNSFDILQHVILN